MLRVDGHDNLQKDPTTGVIINTDRDGLHAAKMAKQRYINSRKKEVELEERIKTLEDLILKITRE